MSADAVQYIVVVTSVLTDVIFLKHRDQLVIDTIIAWLPYITSFITSSTTTLVGGSGATSYTSLTTGVTGTGNACKTVDMVLSILPVVTRLSCLISGYDTRTSTTGTDVVVGGGGSGSGSDGGQGKSSTAVVNVKNTYFEGIDGYEDLTGLLTQTLLALISYALQLDRTSTTSTSTSLTTTTSASAAVIVKDYVKVVSAILTVLKKSIHHITKHSDTFGTDFSPPAEGSVLEKCVIDQCLLSSIYDPESVAANTWEEVYTDILHSHSFSRILTILRILQNRLEDNLLSSSGPNPAGTATSTSGVDKYRLSSINALIMLFKHAITTITTMISHNKDKVGSEMTAFTAIVRGIVAEIKDKVMIADSSSSSSHHHYADLKEPNSTTNNNNNNSTLVEEEEQSEEVYNKGDKSNNKLLRFLSKCEQSLA